MRIFIVGASGRVGKKLAVQLQKAGHEVFAGTRHQEDTFEGTNITLVPFDLNASIAELAQPLDSMDAVYFVAGSRGSELLKVDAYGPVKLAQAAKKQGIRRFVLLSTIFATEPEKWEDKAYDSLREYYIAKYFADRWLIDHSGLDYTILQPGTLTESEATGTVALQVTESGSNSLDDVAAVLAELAAAENSVKKVITMHSGSTPIPQAVQDL